MQNGTDGFDVAILGSGLSGTLVACILARQGARVVVIDPKTHPRFAIGESTIPHTSLLMAILASKYDVPELDHLAYPDRIAAHICRTCGIKRSFGFVYHRAGQRHDVRESIHFGTSSKDENHLFRQDIDAYFLRTAARYGARLLQDTRVERVDFAPDGVTVQTSASGPIRARYVIDASGYKSVLAHQLGLWEEPTRLRHVSRALFTHMIDVPPFLDGRSPMSLPWDKSTLHHIFDGGWTWVIPFNNQPESLNPIASVGLVLDSTRFPRAAQRDPEREFREFLGQFPDAAAQFAGAKAIRPWTATERVQYSTTRCSGERYCLMSHAAGFVDALFSRGLINTLEVIFGLMDPLLAALREDDFSQERFEHINGIQARVLAYNDRLVCGSFRSFRDFELLNAWLRVWSMGTIITEFRVMNALLDYSSTRDEGVLRGETPDPIFSNFEDPEYRRFFDAAAELMQHDRAAEPPVAQTADALFGLLGKFAFPVLMRIEALRRAGWMPHDREMSERALEYARQGFRWALGNPLTRDLFGNVTTLYRWRARQSDPHLVSAP